MSANNRAGKHVGDAEEPVGELGEYAEECAE